MPVTDSLKVVIVRVLRKPSVHKSPREIINSVLLVLNYANHNLSIEIIMKVVLQMAFNWERFVQKLLVILLSRCVAKNDAFSGIVK